jgi:hypothetical protein
MSKLSSIASPTGSPFAVAVMFFGNGLVMASSYSRMPGIRDQLGSTPSQLAFALVCMGIGSIFGMPFTGRLVDRYSSRAVSLVATLICLGGWATIPLARSVPALALMLLITGVGTGVGDVAMNVQGHLVETRRRKVLIPFGDVSSGRGPRAGLSSHSSGINDRLRWLFGWCAADRFSCSHDAPGHGAFSGGRTGAAYCDARASRSRARHRSGHSEGSGFDLGTSLSDLSLSCFPR